MNMKIKSLLERLRHASHRSGAFSSDVLMSISDVLVGTELRTLETGCGKSTAMFSNKSKKHYVFAYDDRSEQNSSVQMVKNDPDFIDGNVVFIYGATQQTLPQFKFSEEDEFDVILLDGPHGYPFPDMEYGIIHNRLKSGGILIIDDIHIASIGRMYEILREDRMYEEVGIFSTTGVLKRTTCPGVPSEGDHWYEQGYNVKRFPSYELINQIDRSVNYNQAIQFVRSQEFIKYAIKGFSAQVLKMESQRLI